MTTIDGHIHYAGDHPDCIAMLRSRGMKLLNVCYAPAPTVWKRGRDLYRRLADEWPELYAWCTTFDPPDFSDPGWSERVISEIADDFSHGACACKVWKNIGMDVRAPSGDWLMIDDPLFDPLFRFLERSGRPVLMHIGEPRECWLPLDPGSILYWYYSQYPEWHMYGKTGFPSHERLVAARDAVVGRWPRIHFVAAHLASLEYSLAEVARRLDRYPNLMVDTGARMPYLFLEDASTVRDFLTRYSGRVIWGSDLLTDGSQAALTEEERKRNLADLEEEYDTELPFFRATGAAAWKDRPYAGLGLPATVADRLTRENARSVYGL
jgi:predicted TIM-barrel fold metal-dependent hydrolase